MRIKMKADRQRRNFWTPDEIGMMLKLIKDYHLRHGCSSTNHNTFVQIANKMKKCGFPNKTALQIRRKWFQMKSAYLCYKRGNFERLLLIPEDFRETVAQFVEAERKYCHMKIDNDETSKKQYKTTTIPTVAPLPNDTKKNNKLGVQLRRELNKTPSDTSTESLGSADSVYQKQIDDFVGNTREMQRILQKDFRRMQEKLLKYQYKCQMARENNVEAFFATRSVNF